MKVIHYTEDTEWKLRKIEIANEFLWCKPKGGIWTSPVGSNYGWDVWCKDEGFRDIDKYIKVELEIEVFESDNLIIIDKKEDLDKLNWEPSRIPGMKFMFKDYIDFVGMKNRGIDCIWLTEEGQWKTRLIFPRNLYGWDCECVLVLNERCIKSWRII